MKIKELILLADMLEDLYDETSDDHKMDKMNIRDTAKFVENLIDTAEDEER